jgi:hypothetical protein
MCEVPGVKAAGKMGRATLSKGIQKAKTEVRVFDVRRGHRPLLPGEGRVGTYGELDNIRIPRSNLAAHHIPNSQYMRSHGVSHNEGISIFVEQPTPGVGGRHRDIHRSMRTQDPSILPRDALAQATQRARHVYMQDGVYTPEIRRGLLEVIDRNKSSFPHLFERR